MELAITIILLCAKIIDMARFIFSGFTNELQDQRSKLRLKGQGISQPFY